MPITEHPVMPRRPPEATRIYTVPPQQTDRPIDNPTAPGTATGVDQSFAELDPDLRATAQSYARMGAPANMFRGLYETQAKRAQPGWSSPRWGDAADAEPASWQPPKWQSHRVNRDQGGRFSAQRQHPPVRDRPLRWQRAAHDTVAADDWVETKHKRDEEGKFASLEGGEGLREAAGIGVPPEASLIQQIVATAKGEQTERRRHEEGEESVFGYKSHDPTHPEFNPGRMLRSMLFRHQAMGVAGPKELASLGPSQIMGVKPAREIEEYDKDVRAVLDRNHFKVGSGIRNNLAHSMVNAVASIPQMEWEALKGSMREWKEAGKGMARLYHRTQYKLDPEDWTESCEPMPPGCPEPEPPEPEQWKAMGWTAFDLLKIAASIVGGPEAGSMGSIAAAFGTELAKDTLKKHARKIGVAAARYAIEEWARDQPRWLSRVAGVAEQVGKATGDAALDAADAEKLPEGRDDDHLAMLWFFHSFADSVRNMPISREQAETWLGEARRELVDYHDDHPPDDDEAEDEAATVGWQPPKWVQGDGPAQDWSTDWRPPGWTGDEAFSEASHARRNGRFTKGGARQPPFERKDGTSAALHARAHSTAQRIIAGDAAFSTALRVLALDRALVWPCGDKMACDAALVWQALPSQRVRMAFDQASVRTFSPDGHLHVALSNISRAQVSPYLGKEIPDQEQLGLDPNEKYMLLRHPDELKKAASTFNGLPLLIEHKPITAVDHPQNLVVGSTGTDARYEHPFLQNSLHVWSKPAIDAIANNTQREISCAYHYVPLMTPGVYEGKQYDGIMTQIHGNHVALVPDGRVGPAAVVADAMPFDLEYADWFARVA